MATKGEFKCSKCGYKLFITQDESTGQYNKPKVCPKCGAEKSIGLVRSIFYI